MESEGKFKSSTFFWSLTTGRIVGPSLDGFEGISGDIGFVTAIFCM